MKNLIKPLKSELKHELKYFYRLNKETRLLAISHFFNRLANPLINIFVTAYLFSKTNNLTIIAFYYLGLYVGLPIIFYLNGLFLKFFSPVRLYALGNIILGIDAFIIVLVSPHSIASTFFFGLIYSLGSGIFWANRQFLTQNTTNSLNRDYFAGLEQATDKTMSVLAPVLIGISIEASQKFFHLNIDSAYQSVFLIGFILQIFSALIVQPIKLNLKIPRYHFLKNISLNWWKYRLLTFFLGISDGIAFLLPPLIILILVGKEAALGSIISLGALASALAVYHINKYTKPKDLLILLIFAFIISFFSSITYALLFTTLGVIIYQIGNNVYETFTWTSTTAILMDLTEKESKINQTSNYIFYSDRELFLNLGRIFATFLFFLTLNLQGRIFTIKFLPLIIVIFQLMVVFVYKKMKFNEDKS